MQVHAGANYALDAGLKSLSERSSRVEPNKLLDI